MTDKPLNEVSGIGSFAKRFANRTKNAALAALGSKVAQGQLDLLDTYETLKNGFSQWRGQTGQPATLQSVDEYLISHYGFSIQDSEEEIANAVEDAVEEIQPNKKKKSSNRDTHSEPLDATQEPPSPQADREEEKPVDPTPKEPKEKTNGIRVVDYSNADINRAVMRLKTFLVTNSPTKEEAEEAMGQFIDYAVSAGGNSKEAALAFIREVENNNRLTSRYPNFKAIDVSLLQEHTSVFRAMMFIVENDISRDQRNAVISHYLTEADYASGKLNSMQLDKVFRDVAQKMFRAGMVSLDGKSSPSSVDVAKGTGQKKRVTGEETKKRRQSLDSYGRDRGKKKAKRWSDDFETQNNPKKDDGKYREDIIGLMKKEEAINAAKGAGISKEVLKDFLKTSKEAGNGQEGLRVVRARYGDYQAEKIQEIVLNITGKSI